MSIKPIITLLFLFFNSVSFAGQSNDNSLNIKLVKIPAGTFIMGTRDIEEAAMERPDNKISMVQDESPAHEVKMTQAFYISATEVTQGQWFDLMQTKPGPDEYWQHTQWRQLPVVSISWNDTQAFIKKLNQRNKALQYRLPSEAEWEYVAKAGSNDLRPMPVEALNDYAWTITNSTDKPQPVAQLKANAFGVYDIYGNAWEWVNDYYAPDTYQQSNRTNPSGPITGSKRIRRGGSYHCPTHMVRPGYRAADTPDTRFSVVGFRVVATKK